MTLLLLLVLSTAKTFAELRGDIQEYCGYLSNPFCNQFVKFIKNSDAQFDKPKFFKFRKTNIKKQSFKVQSKCNMFGCFIRKDAPMLKLEYQEDDFNYETLSVLKKCFKIIENGGKNVYRTPGSKVILEQLRITKDFDPSDLNEVTLAAVVKGFFRLRSKSIIDSEILDSDWIKKLVENYDLPHFDAKNEMAKFEKMLLKMNPAKQQILTEMLKHLANVEVNHDLDYESLPKSIGPSLIFPTDAESYRVVFVFVEFLIQNHKSYRSQIGDLLQEIDEDLINKI